MSLGILGIVWRLICVFLLIIILVELKWAQRHDGEALRSLRGVFASILFLWLFPLTAGLDAYTDFSPEIDLRAILSDWVWIAYAVVATSIVRFWFALHQWSRKKREGTKE